MNQQISIATALSEAGAVFVEGHEGFVSRAYRDPVGVLTIGYGFTNGSPAVRRHLGKIVPGMKITKAKARKVLRAVVDEEFGPAVLRKMPGAKQHQFDQGCSTAFNVGPRVLGWKWAQAFRAGKIARAADLLRTTATTAAGHTLPGLVRRRAEEADLLQFGTYGAAARVAIATVDTVEDTGDQVARDTLAEYQEKLQRLDFYDGQVDGLNGPNTRKAVMAFQATDPHLKADGILGRATMESIDRHIETARSTTVGGAGGVLGLGGTALSWLQMVPPYVAYAAFGLVFVVALYLLWKYRRAFEVKARKIMGV